ncbi:MAG: Gfo/Idh/MocA family oxidoreductase [Candidatus Pristimantibacillus lignocellulolyticus]|uniref:Gfo/Idh/MocA family oxidoreductase n=1 Tax=Candidatus Pristimantibacillus lignocellulolyticus TaxID=2994561 RepID=A0A9J6ZH54_9BACL|nr:MAG: Gfo/Idh/MocA family oxidoreductase [Candidatus Pristimantibacillus lignocellulolyticus]
MSDRKLKWGVLGSAQIAVNSVIPGILQSNFNEVVAIASRNLDKAEETAVKFQIPKTYGSYEQLLQDTDIDVVYIPLPNHLHYEWTIKAIEAGKHVLCEKPLALTAEEAERMVQAAKEAGVILAEAFMYRYHPRYTQLKEIIDRGEIGEVRGIRSSFTFNNANDINNVRYRKEWGGGAIYDVGCYPITAARMLLGKEPEAVTVQAQFSSLHGDVDMMAAGLIEFEGDVSLQFDCAMWSAFRNPLEVLGSEGIIEVPSAFVTPTEESGHFYVTKSGEKNKVSVPFLNAYSLQADALAQAVLQGKPLPFDATDAVHNMKIIDACIASARGKTRVELSE